MKIGIFTHYYKSNNYGGNLQAYALVKSIEDIGYSCEQISYNRSDDIPFHQEKTSYYKRFCRKIKNIIKKISYIKMKKTLKKRKTAIDHFNSMIPHSNVITKKELNTLWKQYDVFITGSDQVWHPATVCDGYLLKFDTKGKPKFSYAASFAVSNLPSYCRAYYREALLDFQSISVREEKAVKIVADMNVISAQWVLDPTLLLTAEEWDSVCSEQKIQENYILCYFLGKVSLKRKDIIKFAKKRNLKVLTMPFLSFQSGKDCDFGDYRSYNSTPEDFLSFIKYAKYIFTDSFHATVFSHIFKRDFFVFNRQGASEMNDRIYSLSSLFDTQDRFCDTKEKETLEYIESLPPIDYSKPFPKFEEMKEKSINFLKDNLKKAEEKINGNQ